MFLEGSLVRLDFREADKNIPRVGVTLVSYIPDGFLKAASQKPRSVQPLQSEDKPTRNLHSPVDFAQRTESQDARKAAFFGGNLFWGGFDRATRRKPPILGGGGGGGRVSPKGKNNTLPPPPSV